MYFCDFGAPYSHVSGTRRCKSTTVIITVSSCTHTQLSESWLKISLKLIFQGKVALGEKLWSCYFKTSTLAPTSGPDKNWNATKQINRPQTIIDNPWNIAHIIIVNILLLYMIHSDCFNKQDYKVTSLSCEKLREMNFINWNFWCCHIGIIIIQFT